MQCTPESNLHLEGYKGQHSVFDNCSDSGYSGFFQSPHSITGADSCRSLSPVELDETPKENLRLSVTPKEKVREPVRFLGSRKVLQSSTVSWCETPKVYKRDSSLRHRLLMCKPTTDWKNDNTRSPCTRKAESPISGSEPWFSTSFDSVDIKLGASSPLKVNQDLTLSGRKRRVLFTQAPGFNQFLPVSKENSQSPLGSLTDNLYDSSSVLYTPSSTPNFFRSVSEDSGFSSVTLDKSQDSSVDHDGSFQELLLSASKGNFETPNPTEAKRRSRFQRQHRLSTLKEGSSQSEDDPTHHPYQCHSRFKEDEVFAEDATPRCVLPVKCGNNMACDSLALAKQDNTTPLRVTRIKAEHMTPCCTDPDNTDITPLRTTPVNLSLTPALQLVYAMCQHNAQVLAGQSPSLKEQLKSAAALTKTPVTFRTTMPLAGLIGRKMGLERVDVLTELKKRNLRHILAFILCQLDSESVYRCGRVCKSWNQIIQQDKLASSRRRSHLSQVEAALEIGGIVHVNDVETRVTLVKRSALKTVQAQSRTSSYCTPQSGNSTLETLQLSALHSGSSGKRDKFLEVAKTLFNDECLKPCPRCQHPARCHSGKGEGVCSRADCGFQFCMSCLCTSHGSKECGSQSAGRRRRDVLPGSAQSKRNVRRL
ncbi:F-box only protein 43 isoform X2 [Archocentrus centrarchus]|uniref:F-box only protein 43 isoform X2 n=1 Tax=Archocentrus centrarchus TaxID=63155 RepID=UPI0011E9E618|nr:F-box only protein 43 isoform X2 [Archocentrus centrarchus]